MIAMNDNCLAPDEIHEVARGVLHGDALETALEHIDQCPKCRDSIEAMDVGKPWIAESLAENNDPFQGETACQMALWRIMETSDVSRSKMPPPSPYFPINHLGPYELLRPLGSGGMATVYLAEHQRLKRQCAIKILPRERVDEPGWLDRFDREMTTVASLEHPNVVRATDAGHEDGWHYLVMEYLEGLDVGQVAGRMQRLSIPDACEIVRQAAQGLDHIHRCGLVHRDIKPSNLMLTRDGTVKLLDLGLVLSGDDPLAVEDRLTTVGHLMGTLPYMSPEQLLDSRDVDARADIYALGATLYRLISGRPPHTPNRGLAKQVMAITGNDAMPLSSIRDDVDKELSDYVQQLISKRPEERPAVASSIAESLEVFSRNATLKRTLRTAQRIPATANQLPSLAPSLMESPSEPPKGRRSWWIASAAVLMFLLAGWTFKIVTDRGDLVIKGVSRDVTLEVRKGDKLVETLQVEATDENRFKLRKGEYEIAIVGATGLTLDEGIVTIGRGTETRLELQSEAESRLYRGKDLRQWMSLLNREEDPNALGEVMEAVEVLTRNTELRQQAASDTMRTARIWGGFASSSPEPSNLGLIDRNPSHHFMHHFNEIYPRYGADGIPAIRAELKHGNLASRLASVWLLSNAAFHDIDVPTAWLDELRIAVEAIDASENRYSSQAAQSGRGSAIRWLNRNDLPIEQHTWLHGDVIATVRKSYQRWQENPNPYASLNSFGAIGGTLPFLQEPELVAAIELHELGKLELDWQWISANLFSEVYGRESENTDEAIKFVNRVDPNSLISAMDRQLSKYKIPTVDGMGQQFGQMGPTGSFWENSQWLPMYRLCMPLSKWPVALPLFAEKMDAEIAKTRLNDIRIALTNNGIDPDHPDQPLRFIDQALGIVGKRIDAVKNGPSQSPDGDLPNP